VTRGGRGVEQYVRVYAEPECALADALTGSFERVLVVPARRESPELLAGFVGAAQQASGSTCCVLVVNGSSQQDADANAALLAALQSRLQQVTPVDASGRAFAGASPELRVLVIDRASAGRELPPDQGVGLARKIGCDVALQLWARGAVASRWLFCTDADVTLPDSYFGQALAAVEPRLAAIVFPFVHAPSGDAAIDEATALYELSLRYYVLGLAWAESPYAFHTVGSSIAVAAAAYANVRGFPRRAAAEDFYILNKLAKQGPIVRGCGDPIRIRARSSDRVPFGTGKGVEKLIETGQQLSLYDPRVFAGLRDFLQCLNEFARHRDGDRGLAALAQSAAAAPLLELAEEWRLRAVLIAAAEQSSSPERLRFRLHEWFDAFRTLKLVHRLRDRQWPLMGFRSALATAPFVSCETTEAASVLCRDLAKLERALPRLTGPTLYLRASQAHADRT
jgi:hypothetical protein